MTFKIPLHVQILLALPAGLAFGYFFPAHIGWAEPLGAIFLRLLRMIVVPLIFVSIADGVAQAGSGRGLSRLGFKAAAYYLATNFLAVLTALVLVNAIRPGDGVRVFGSGYAPPAASGGLLDFIPQNIFEAFARGETLQIIFAALVFGAALAVSAPRARGL